MKTSILISTLILNFSIYGQADFSGNWKLSTNKSRFNNTPGAPAASYLYVEQKSGVITFQRDKRQKETLKIDSTMEVEIKSMSSEGGITKVSIKATRDNLGLIETRKYIYPHGTKGIVATKKIRTWTLSADKKTLIIHDFIETTDKDRNYNMLLIYDREN